MRLRAYSPDEERDASGKWSGGGAKETVVLSFGRFNPPHRGHKILLDKLVSTAKITNGEAVLFVNPKTGEKDPLNVEDKIRYLKIMQPTLTVESKSKSEVPDPEDILKLYSERGYKHLVLVEGGDRRDWFKALVEPRMKSGELKFEDYTFVDAGDRAAETSWSATQQRDAAKKGDYVAFKAGLPAGFADVHAMEMYQRVRNAYGLAASPRRKKVAGNAWPKGWGDGDD